jgi:hypothetical protein
MRSENQSPARGPGFDLFFSLAAGFLSLGLPKELLPKS